MVRLFIDFVPLLLWMGLVAALVVIMLLASWVLRPHVLQNSEKTSTYECGEEPLGPARISFPYSYIIYTVLFLVVNNPDSPIQSDAYDRMVERFLEVETSVNIVRQLLQRMPERRVIDLRARARVTPARLLMRTSWQKV